MATKSRKGFDKRYQELGAAIAQSGVFTIPNLRIHQMGGCLYLLTLDEKILAIASISANGAVTFDPATDSILKGVREHEA